MSVIVKGWRYHVPFERTAPDLHTAMRDAWADNEYGEAWIEAIIDGQTVYDREAIEAYWVRMGWREPPVRH